MSTYVVYGEGSMCGDYGILMQVIKGPVKVNIR